MAKRILLGALGVPGWGGGATAAYHLFDRMQRDGLDVAYVNIVEERDEVFLRYLFGDHFSNPRSLENVHTCLLDGSRWNAPPGLSNLMAALSPDLLLGCGHVAAWLMKQAAPAIANVVWTGRSSGVQRLIEGGAVRDFMQFRQLVAWGVAFQVRRDDLERKAMEASDLILVSSPLVRFAMEHLYAGEAGKIYANVVSTADLVYAEAERFRSLRRPFPERDIDVLFVANSWDRPEKNYSLAARIAARCEGIAVTIIGEIDRPRGRASYRGLVTCREELYALLGRSKTFVCPSLIDGGPGILFEASAMECNVIASPNCGNWRLCHPDLLAERYTVGTFVDRIEKSLRQPYRDNREQFRGGYADLLDTLSVL